MSQTESVSESVSLGDLITLFFEEFFVIYHDEDLASVAAAATINEILSRQTAEEVEPVSA